MAGLLRRAAALAAPMGFVFALAAPARAASSEINTADTAWMIVAMALVLMMTIPGLALFYSGMVRKKNVLATMAQSLAAVTLISILWVAFGYSLCFVGDGPWIGSLDRWFLAGMTMDSVNPAAKTIPESLFMLYQMTFAIITVALVAGSVADRMRFSAYLLFSVAWFIFVYIPLAHWVWGGGFLASMGVMDFAGGLVVHLSAGTAGLVAAKVMGRRHGYGTENLSPFDLSLAVMGTGLLWVGWFGFNGGSAGAANSRAVMAIIATHLAACSGALTWGAIEWSTRRKPSVLGMISGAVAGLGTITPASGFVAPWHGIVIGIAAVGIDVEIDRPARILRFQEQELRADQSGHRVIDLAVEEDDALAQEARIDVEGTFAARRLFDDHRDELKHVAHRRPPCLQNDEVLLVLGRRPHQAAIAVGRLRQLDAIVAGLLDDAKARAAVIVRFDPENDVALAKRRLGIAQPIAHLFARDR
jgi:Amt family ammonium transporter